MHKRRKHRGRALQNSGYDHRTFDILTVQLMYRIESTEKFRQRCPIGSTISHCLLTSFSPYFANQLPLCGCVCQSGAKNFLLILHLILLFAFIPLFSSFFALVMQKEFRVRHVGVCMHGFYWTATATATKTRMDNNRSIRRRHRRATSAAKI